MVAHILRDGGAARALKSAMAKSPIKPAEKPSVRICDFSSIATPIIHVIIYPCIYNYYELCCRNEFK